MTLTTIFSIIIIHWIADFIFQDVEWSNNNSKSLDALLSHTSVYSNVWLIFLFITHSFDYLIEICSFSLITFILHTITDYFTSKVVSKKFENKEYGSSIPNFGAFTIIGFDQILHYVQLFTIYYLFFIFKFL